MMSPIPQCLLRYDPASRVPVVSLSTATTSTAMSCRQRTQLYFLIELKVNLYCVLYTKYGFDRLFHINFYALA